MVIIPMFQETSSTFTQLIKLDDAMYSLKIQYNVRSESFMFSIYDNEGNLLVAGMKLVPNYDLAKQFNYLETLPTGNFILLDLEPLSKGTVSFENLGTRYQFIYFSEGEL